MNPGQNPTGHNLLSDIDLCDFVLRILSGYRDKYIEPTCARMDAYDTDMLI